MSEVKPISRARFRTTTTRTLTVVSKAVTLVKLCPSRTMWVLQPPSGKGTRHQFAQTKFMERSDGGQVVPPEAIVNHAQSRHDDAWAVAIAKLHDRQPELHMLVVPSRNQFVRPQKEDWPRANLLSHDITIPLFDVQDFRGGRRLKAGEACNLVPRNQ